MATPSWIPLGQVTLDDPFWKQVQTLLRTVVLPYQWEILNDRVEGAEPSHCIQNFRIAAGEVKGWRLGVVFQDSDLYKWLEAVAYALIPERNAALEALADQAVSLIGRAQQPDGYLNTYYTVNAPSERWMNLTEGHELYCAGHLIEAAVAYQQATGKPELLNIACRLADCLCERFMDGRHGYPGHPEVEVALVRLYEETDRYRYLELCRALINARGEGESLRAREEKVGGYTPIWDHFSGMTAEYLQDHLPVRRQAEAAGHAVRAMYLYSAMADLALLDGDTDLRAACAALFDSVTRRRMYVTGAIGSCADGERFTLDYDLPNDLAYAETCASVGLMMFARRMWRIGDDPACYDVWERSLNNAVLAGMGRDGKHFFYVNPLEVSPERIRATPALAHVLTQRPQWFGVACCPPNLARCVLSLGGSLYALDSNGLTVLSHLESHAETEKLNLCLARKDDRYTLTLNAPEMRVRLRIPEGYTLSCETGESSGGYWEFRHEGGSRAYAYHLTPRIRVVSANPRIAADAGKGCVCCGASVYCLEEADNGKSLCELALSRNAVFRKTYPGWLPTGMFALETEGVRYSSADWSAAYEDREPEAIPVKLTFVPYSQWNNRGEGEMTVWVGLTR